MYFVKDLQAIPNKYNPYTISVQFDMLLPFRNKAEC